MTQIKMAKDPNTTPEKLHELARIENWAIRLLVSQNPSISADTIEYLAAQDCYIDWQVLKALALNPNATKKALHDIALKASTLETCIRVINHPNVGIKTLWFLVNILSLDILDDIAKNPKTPALMLHAMAWKYDGRWALDVVNHPNVSEATLRKLSKSKNKVVADAAAANYAKYCN